MANITSDRVRELIVADLVLQGYSEDYAKLDAQEWFDKLQLKWLAIGEEAGRDANIYRQRRLNEQRSNPYRKDEA